MRLENDWGTSVACLPWEGEVSRFMTTSADRVAVVDLIVWDNDPKVDQNDTDLGRLQNVDEWETERARLRNTGNNSLQPEEICPLESE